MITAHGSHPAAGSGGPEARPAAAAEDDSGVAEAASPEAAAAAVVQLQHAPPVRRLLPRHVVPCTPAHTLCTSAATDESTQNH